MKKKTTTEKKTPAAATGKTVSAKAAAVKKDTAVVVEKKTVRKKLPLPSVTTLVATADIGWGNQLYVRGEGGGLSWESGIPMTCNGTNEWVWVSTSNDPVFSFKFLLNDKFWSQGDNLVAVRGETHNSHPQF